MSRYARMLALWSVIVSAFCFVLTQKAYGLKESTGPDGSDSIAVHQLGITGEGVNVGFISAGNVLTTHEAFKDANGVSHAFNYDFTGDGISIIAHDTQLAGIIASRGGVAYPNDIGVAPGADIYCARVANNSGSISSVWIVNALDTLINTYNCRIIVTGFELTGIDPNGDNPWTRLYDYYAYQYGVIFTNAAGNENTYVAIFGDAYNGITTGGLRLNDPNNPYEYRMVGSVSGSGPTTDGRRKPDITAPSQNQWVPTSSSDTAWTTTYSPTGGETSWSIPHAAGAAALLLELADTTPGPNDNDSNVIKAIIVNSTMPNVNNKAGASTNPADSNNTWQADRGYGRLDCLRAYQLLDTNEVEPGTTITQNKGWGLGRIGQGATNVYTIHIPARCRLIATTTWPRRIAWTDKWPKNGIVDLDELTGYLANLDMNVVSPYEPNVIFSKAQFSYDESDNLIKCDLLILTPGNYTITIANKSTTNETVSYGFAFELHPIMAGDLPQVDYIVDYNDLSTLTADWLSTTSPLDAYLATNGIIDFADFAILAQDWLQIDLLYYQY
ncbi:MAG: S8 family serine peptidase [Sedimentisphaerales bacterium]